GWQLRPPPAVSMRCHVWDAAYAHGVYGWKGIVPDHEVAVWSASKLFGLSGLRVGWLVTKDEDFAKDAARYVEATTSGVSVLPQHRVAKVLWYKREEPDEFEQGYMKARQTLLANAGLFNNLLGKYVRSVEGTPNNGVGMFAYFVPHNGPAFRVALNRANVL